MYIVYIQYVYVYYMCCYRQCRTDCVKTFEWRVLPQGNFTCVT